MRRAGGPSPPEADLEALREQLRRLGYLKGPFSGWLFHGQAGRWAWLRTGARASLRAGMLGGPLLAVPAAIGVAIAHWPQISAPRDLLGLFAYLVLVLGGGLALLEFLTDVVLVGLARRGLVLLGRAERLAGRLGLLFTIGTTLYLAYLVRGGRVAQAGEVAWQGWFVWSALLAMALGVGHVIGGLTRLGSIATMMVAAGAVGPPARRHRVRRRVAVVWTVVGLAGVTAALVFVPAGAGDRTPPAFRPRPSSGRIVVIGVDGLSSDLLDRMTALGVCPTIARLERTAARYAIAREPGLTPPRAWTTIATGRPASEHGVLGYSAGPIPGVSTLVQETRRSAGLSLGLLMPPLFRSRAPVDAGFRRAKALWEILPGGGVPTAAVNWWATWPAGRGPAVVMSQRAFIRFSAGAAPHEDVWPPSLQRSLSSSFQADRREALSLLRGFLMGGDEGGLAQRAGLIDGYHARVAGRLLDQASLRVLLLYLPGIDILRSGQAGAASAPVTRLVAHLDALIEPFVRRMTDQDLLLLVGDPGRQEAGGAVAPGVLLVRSGRIAVAGRRSETISLLDLAPTVLALAGFPMAEDLPGRPVLDFLDEKARARLSAGKISTFGDRPSPAGEEAADPLDEEVLDRLRSLGYIR